ncbi:MAG TPA: 5-formyltetrahydrofolate cyclo-ligase, partial [Verrucomicrobiae bacterium]|nr:5-formyltetrahydrofolate cyclo-ligase [Verrucomicrobiae bacterium]
MTRPTTIPEQKAALRKELRAMLRALPLEVRAERSARLIEILESLELWREAQSVMLFSPLPDEPDIAPLIERALAEGKAVCLPRHDVETATYFPARITGVAGDLARSHLGLLEPSAHCAAHPGKQLDLTLVPGLGFTQDGWRLGRGKG